jgi:rubrerythrin
MKIDTWRCSRCTTIMESKWWTCSTCGKMKESS